MALYAAGFNAWNQLVTESTIVTDEPDDVETFTCVLTDDSGIFHVEALFSYTLVHLRNGDIKTLGKVPNEHQSFRFRHPSFVEALNDTVVVHNITTQTLHQSPSLLQLLSSTDLPAPLPNVLPITQLVTYDTGFAALSVTGEVYTWGDERYTACFGRDVTDESPAHLPSLVSDLCDLPSGPITKLAARGYLIAAITAGKDLYVWGHAGRTQFRPVQDEDNDNDKSYLPDVPTPVVIHDPLTSSDKDIADVAVGQFHMIALTTDNELFVIGSNANGQLGLPSLAPAVDVWTQIPKSQLGLKPGQVVIGVAAGPRSSFLIVQ